jgi:hypothetical protein
LFSALMPFIGMQMDSIDASIIGLQATLQLLQQYYQSGTLEADVSAAFRKGSRYTAHIEIVEGKVVSCYIQDKVAQYPSKTEALLALDADEGPFTWRFHPRQQKPPSDTSTSVAVRSQSRPSPEQLTPNAIPRRIANLDLSWLTAWSSQQKRILRMVYTLVDGRRTVATIERSVPLPHTLVQEALVVLIAMQIITVNTQ